MVHADLAVLGGVGLLSLACLVVCSLYVYWSSERYRARKQQIRMPRSGAARPAGNKSETITGVQTTMGTQVSQRCKTSLFRVLFNNAHDESIVFLMAASRDEARRQAAAALAAIHGMPVAKVALSHFASFRDLVDIGVSEDEDLRIFELSWKDETVSAWVEHPLFLTDDSSLLGKWAELYADLAREIAVSAIDKARH